MFLFQFLIYSKLVNSSSVSKLRTLKLENGLYVEKGLVRIQNDEQEKEFCKKYGMNPINDISSYIVSVARDARKYQPSSRYPICWPENQKDYDIEWKGLAIPGCANACHKRCKDESCEECDNFCQSPDSRCCSGSRLYLEHSIFHYLTIFNLSKNLLILNLFMFI